MAAHDNDVNITADDICNQNFAYSSMFQFYVWGIGANTIACLGLIGNLLSVIVLSNRRMRSSTSCYLISLAIYDSFVLLSMALFMAIPTLSYGTAVFQPYVDFYPYMQPYAYPIALISQTGTIYTTVGFTVERFIAVCRPLRAAVMCTVSRAKKVITIIFICSVLYNIPRMLEFQVVEYIDPLTNESIVKWNYTELGNNEAFREAYFIYLNLVVMFWAPFLLLLILNIFLIRAVKASSKMHLGINVRAGNKDQNLTIMLIAVIVVFLICQLPSIADNILWTILSEAHLHCSIMYLEFTTISNFMVIINSATNFLLYCLFGRKFRKVFFWIFGCYKCRKFNPAQTSLLMKTRLNDSAGKCILDDEKSANV